MKKSKFVILSFLSVFLLIQRAVAENEIIHTIPENGLIAIGVGVLLGLAGLGAALGMGMASSAACGAIAEKPEIYGRTMLFIVFIEAIAIYAFVIALMMATTIIG
ncbi:ATP synthase subunit C [Candidatus Borrarchaeum sp.]|uniref:ATP synthase subunit C n=1 Tax=Candidatus Borrarchaeum sp. TaxID=2846742 RepID=UPI002579B446|nr:ATP synthase subunit C [Candidatus Borrarchaeum sp.]